MLRRLRPISLTMVVNMACTAWGIDRDAAKAQGLVIEDLEDDEALQEAVLSVHHAIMHTMGMSLVAKIVENHAA